MTPVLDPTLLPATRSRLIGELGERRTRSLISTGAVVPLWSGVLVSRETLLDPRVRARAAVLVGGPDAALVARTAAWLHGCEYARGPVVHLGVPYSRYLRCREGLVVRQGRGLLDEVTEVDGLPTVPIESAVADLLRTAPRQEALAIADQAAALVPAAGRAALLARIAERVEGTVDRRGRAEALALLALVTGRAESPRESRLALLVVESGFPPPEAQHEVLDLAGRCRYRLDLAWPHLRIAVEYDGFEAHEHRAAEDAERDRDLRSRGWIVLRVRAADLDDPGRILAELGRAFRARGACTAPATGPLAADLRAQRRRARRAGARW